MLKEVSKRERKKTDYVNERGICVCGLVSKKTEKVGGGGGGGAKDNT